MTDTAFYAEMNALATELLTEFGSPATLVRQGPVPKPNAEGKVVKPTPQHFPGLAVETLSEAVRDQLTGEFKYVHVVKFPTKPQIDDKLVHAGQVVEVKTLKLVDPAGTGLIVAFLGSIKP